VKLHQPSWHSQTLKVSVFKKNPQNCLDNGCRSIEHNHFYASKSSKHPKCSVISIIASKNLDQSIDPQPPITLILILNLWRGLAVQNDEKDSTKPAWRIYSLSEDFISSLALDHTVYSLQWARWGKPPCGQVCVCQLSNIYYVLPSKEKIGTS
jgi:hypothetical protein